MVTWPRDHACMMGKVVMDVQPSCSFHITIKNFDNTEVHLPKRQKVGKTRIRLKI